MVLGGEKTGLMFIEAPSSSIVCYSLLSFVFLLCELSVLALVWFAPPQHNVHDRSHDVGYSDYGLRESVDHLVPDLWKIGSDADRFEQPTRITDKVFD